MKFLKRLAAGLLAGVTLFTGSITAGAKESRPEKGGTKNLSGIEYVEKNAMINVYCPQAVYDAFNKCLGAEENGELKIYLSLSSKNKEVLWSDSYRFMDSSLYCDEPDRYLGFDYTSLVLEDGTAADGELYTASAYKIEIGLNDKGKKEFEKNKDKIKNFNFTVIYRKSDTELEYIYHKKGRFNKKYYDDADSGKDLKAPELEIWFYKTKPSLLLWTKTEGAEKYQIYYREKDAKKYKRLVTVSAKKGCYLLDKFEKGKTYYFKVRAYKTTNGKKVYSKFSDVSGIVIQ